MAARRIDSLEEIKPNIFEAIKRAYIKRGIVPPPLQRRNPSPSAESLKKPEPDNQRSSGKDRNIPNRSQSDNQDKPDGNKSSGDKKPRPRPNSNDGKGEGPMHTKFSRMESKPGENMDKTAEFNRAEKTPEGGMGGAVDEWPPQNLRNEITSTDPEVSVIDSERGSQEAAKDPAEPEPGKTHEKLIDLTEKAQDVLFGANTVFPFSLFPDTITLDREKLTIANRAFFRVAKIITVPITSMISAECDVGPFFGTVRMTSKYFIDNSHEVNFLWRHDAITIHRLLQGFIIAHERGLELQEIEKDDLIVLLEDLGQGVSD